MDAALPEPFAHLTRFVAKWDQPESNSRYAVRLASTMGELREFYDAMMTAGEDIKAHLDAKPMVEFDESEKRLARLMFALPIVAQAVEVYKEVAVPDTGATAFEYVIEPDLP